MGALDIAIVGPALPAIQKQFQIDERVAAWIFSIYVLFNLIGTPFMAKLSDQVGRKKIYILDLALFAFGSLVVSVSPNLTILLLGRAIQGFGSSGIFPVASAVIGDTFPEEKRGGALGLIGAVFGIAFLIGPAIAGVLLLLSWHWLFIVNIPIAIVIIFFSLKTLPEKGITAKSKFDWNGTLCLSFILAALAIGFNQINSSDFINSFFSLQVLPLFIIAILILPYFIKSERKIENPILRIKLLSSKQVVIASFLAIGAGISEASVVFIPPLLVEKFTVSNSQASFLLLPIVLALAAGSPIAGKMLDKAGSKLVLIIGTILLAVGFFGFSVIMNNILTFYVAAIITGIGMGFLIGAPLRYIMLNEAELYERASAQGVIRLFTGVGQLLGSAFVGAIASSAGGGSNGLKKAYFSVGLVFVFLIFASFGLKSKKEEKKTS